MSDSVTNDLRMQAALRWIKENPKAVAARIIRLEDRVTELQDKMHRCAIGLKQVADNVKRVMGSSRP